jgi:hypothetical protein
MKADGKTCHLLSLWFHAQLMFSSDVSEEHIASIIAVEKIIRAIN